MTGAYTHKKMMDEKISPIYPYIYYIYYYIIIIWPSFTKWSNMMDFTLHKFLWILHKLGHILHKSRPILHKSMVSLLKSPHGQYSIPDSYRFLVPIGNRMSHQYHHQLISTAHLSPHILRSNNKYFAFHHL